MPTMASLLLKFVQSFVDRHGYVRHYFRRPGYARVALPGLPGSLEFMAAYQAALGGATAPKVEVGATRTIAGTMHWLITAYLSSPPFKTLAPETQRTVATSSKTCAKRTATSGFSRLSTASESCCWRATTCRQWSTRRRIHHSHSAICSTPCALCFGGH